MNMQGTKEPGSFLIHNIQLEANNSLTVSKIDLVTARVVGERVREYSTVSQHLFYVDLNGPAGVILNQVNTKTVSIRGIIYR